MAGKRYSAGRIFLQVVPSFNNLHRNIAREVAKANEPLQKQQEELGEKQEAARARGASKARTRTQDQELRDAEKHASAQIKQFQRFAQGMVDSRVREGQRVRKVEEKNAQNYLNLISRNVQAESKLRQRAAADQEKFQKGFHERLQAAEKKHADNLKGTQDGLTQFIIKKTMERVGRETQIEKDGIDKRAAMYLKSFQARTAQRVQESIIADREARKQAESAAKAAALMERERRRLSGGELGQRIRRESGGAAEALGPVDVNTSAAHRRIAELREELIRLSDVDIDVDMDLGAARAKIKLITAELEKLARKNPDIDVDVNIAAALVGLKRIEQQLDQNNRKAAKGGLLGMLLGTKNAAEDGANSFRVFNIRIFALLLAVPLLTPMIASLAGAIGALGTAAIGGAVGLGVMFAGFSGISDAVSAMGDVQENATKDTLARTKAIRNASRAVRDAQQSLSRAREDAARAAEDSSRRIADAEERLAESQKDAKRAQDDLARARADAQRQQDDLADRIAAGKLDERQALIDLFNAQVDYNAAMADGSATNLEREQAAIALERARLAIKGVRKENADLNKEQKEGGQAAKNIADAEERAADAQKRVAEARRGVTDAIRDQERQQVDSARAIRDAQERVQDAQAGYQEALVQTGDIGSSSADKLRKAMDKLSPAGQRFATFLHTTLLPRLIEWRKIIQEGMLPGVQESIESLLSRFGPGLSRFLGVMSKVVGDFFIAFSKALQSPVMVTFFEVMEKFAPIFFTQFGKVGILLMETIAGLATAFAPFAKEFMDGLIGMMRIMRDWAADLKDNPAFQDFLAYVRKDGPKVLKLLGSFATIIINLMIGMSESGLFDTILNLFSFLASLDPKVISGLFQAIIGFAIASQIAAGITSLVISFQLLAATPIGLITLAIIGLVAVMVWLYNNNETVRKGIDAAWAWITKVFSGFMDWIKTSFLPWWSGTAMPIITGVFKAIGDFGIWLWETLQPVFRVIGELFMIMVRIFKAFWENILWPVLKAIGAVLGWLWENVGKPVFSFLGDAFETMVTAMVWVWDHVLKPMFEGIADLLEGDFQGAWENAVSAIGGIWDGLKKLVAEPINFVINTVLNNGLIKAFNSVMEFLGLSTRIAPLKTVDWNDSPSYSKKHRLSGANKKMAYGGFHTGGYTGPGAKYQPAGVVHADEFVIRKEATNRLRQQIGLEGLNFINQYGVLPSMNGYAIGGMVKPVNARPGFPWGRYPSGKVHRALDLPAPAGTPIVAPYPGIITRDGWDSSGYGNHVRMQAFGLGNGTHWILGHMLREVVSVGQRVLAGQLLGFVGSTGHSTGNHLHLAGRTRPYDDLSAFDFTAAFNGGRSVTPSVGKPGADLPWWADRPLDFLRGIVNAGVSKIPVGGFFGSMLKGIPNFLFDGVESFLSGILGGNDSAMGFDSATGGAIQTEHGSVPYNGSMMFDNGGYLQPGVTTVLNMTGKPEPVFTDDQWRTGSVGAAALIGEYSPHFHDASITSSDVALDLTRTLQRVALGGKFAGRTF